LHIGDFPAFCARRTGGARMAQKSLLITGCSSGIGYDAAVTMRDRGWRVFASCRKPEDCERLRAEGFDAPHLDYNDNARMKSALAEVLEATGGTLDALYNNGAHGLPGAVEDLPTDALRAIFEVNFFGWHELTRAVIPVMRAQGHGRIVQCSSILGFTVMRGRAAYNATKYALEGLTDTLRIEMRGTGIEVSLIEPGPVTTKIRENAIPHFEKWIDWKNAVRAAEYEAGLIKRLYQPSGKKDAFGLPPSSCSTKLVHALEARRPRPRYYVTGLTHIMGTLRRILPTRAMDWLIARY